VLTLDAEALKAAIKRSLTCVRRVVASNNLGGLGRILSTGDEIGGSISTQLVRGRVRAAGDSGIARLRWPGPMPAVRRRRRRRSGLSGRHCQVQV
jgi:hypothetical protein